MEKNKNIKYIIGEKFSDFAKRKQKILLFNEFEKSLKNNLETLKNTKFLFGQGNSANTKKKILQKIKEECPWLNIIHNEKEVADKSLTHKHDIKNSLISIPEKLTEEVFTSSLIIDSPTELEDHVTGQHIPGMVLIEAGRQLFIAVMEKYFLKKKVPNIEFYFVLHNINSEFINYVFPIPSKIYLEVTNFKEVNSNIYNSQCSIYFFQIPGKCCAKMQLKFGMINKKILTLLENNNALEMLEFRINN